MHGPVTISDILFTIDHGMNMTDMIFRDQKAFADDDSRSFWAFDDVLGVVGDTACDEDFPALPARRPAAPPGLSRVTSVNNSIDLSTRASTPKLPPGLNIGHGHPSPAQKKETPIANEAAKAAAAAISAPTVPAVPLLPLGSRTGTPKAKSTDSIDEKKPSTVPEVPAGSSAKIETSIAAANVSLGSPKPRRTHAKAESESKSLKPTETSSQPVQQQEKGSEIRKDDKKDVKSKGPGKITIPPIQTETKNDMAQPGSTVVGTGIVETPSAIPSQSSTPATPSGATTKPMVMRLVTGTAKTADTTPASATTEKSLGALLQSSDRQQSRRPSVSSVAHTRSSTPAMSEAFSFGASRASSPPPSIIGSAPERTTTKAQQRKNRKEKAKQSIESEQASGTTTPQVDEVAPVISRQRKQKKRVESSADSGFPQQSSEDADKVLNAKEKKKESSHTPAKLRGSDAEPQSAAKPKRQDSVQTSAPSTPREAEPKPSPLIVEPPQPKWTLRDLYNYTSKHPEADVQTLLNTHVSSMTDILASLMVENDVDISNSLFNPPPLSSYRLPADSRRGAEYLDANGYTDSNPFGMLYLTQDKKRAIQNGHAVRISDASKPNDLLRRAMVSPTGTVWRHLTEAEEERVLELEERRDIYAEEYGAMGLGMMDKLTVLEDDDYMNLEGGMDRLSRHGEAHGVNWVMHEDEDEDDDDGGHMDGEDDLDYDEDDDGDDLTDDDEDLGLNVPGGWEAGLALGTVPDNVHITNKANVLPPMRLTPTTGAAAAAASGGVTNVTSSVNKKNLRAMGVDQLVEKIREAQREVEAARRELEKVEKSVGKKSKEAGRWREASLVSGLGLGLRLKA